MNFAMKIVVFLCFVAYGSCAQPTKQNGTTIPTVENGTTINWNDDFETDSSEGTDLETEYDAKGLQPYYDFVNSFIATVLNKDPYDFVLKVRTDGKLPSSDYLKDEVILGFALGMTIVVAIGVLFCIFMPIVGLCFCCCRLCGKCGGEMSQKDSPNNSCKRAVFAVILFIISLLMFTGVLLTFVCNDRMSDTVDTFRPSINKMVDEGISFINRTIGEVEKLLLVDFPFVVNRLDEDVSDKGVRTHIGDPLLSELNTVLQQPINAVSNLSKETTKMRDQLERIQNISKALNASTVELQSGLEETRQNLTEIQNECNSTFPGQSACDIDTSDLRTEADFTDLPDVSDQLGNIEDIVNDDFEASAQEGLKEVQNIPETFINKTRQQRDDIRTMIANASDKVMVFRDDLRKIADKDVISKLQELQGESLPNAEDFAKEYDHYRWIAGVCLTCILLLIVVLLFLGLMCGVCGYDKEATPTTRGSVSNMGGISLMAATGFCFIFSWLLMLLATICFIVGAPAQTVCKSIQTGEFFSEVLDNTVFWDNSYFLSDAIFNRKDIPLTIGGLIRDCRENKPLYQAAKIGEAFNVKEKFDIEELLGNDTTKQFNDLNIDLKDQDVLTNDTRTSLEELRDSGVDDISFDSFLNETSKAITAVDLEAFAKNVTNLANGLRELGDNSPAGAQKDKAYELGNRSLLVAEDLRYLDRVVVGSMRDESADLDKNVKELEDIGGNIKDFANDTLQKAEEAQNYLHNQATNNINKVVTAYTNRVLGWVYQFRDHLLDALENDLARCKPLTNIYDAGIVLICNTALYPFNGFWFSIGWCLFFFIPAIIFSVKLAKHYRRMQYESDFDQEMYPGHFEMTDHPPPAYPSHEKKQWANPNGYPTGESRY